MSANNNGRSPVCYEARYIINYDLPNVPETYVHRIGRTGRAGKKGTAVLVVPYPRRRRVESMLRGARIEAEAGPDAVVVHDIPLLADHFLRRFTRKHGVKVTGFSERANTAMFPPRTPTP